VILSLHLRPAWDHESYILCPAYGDNYVHIAAVEIDRGGNVLTVSNEAEAVMSQRTRGARGAVLTIELWGECGHRFALQLRFNKGNTFLSAEKRLDMDPGECSDLWRD
jgi:hypothetical protein